MLKNSEEVKKGGKSHNVTMFEKSWKIKKFLQNYKSTETLKKIGKY